MVALFSFICSANNNITRIAKMVLSLCQEYGALACIIDGRPYYSFPKLSGLALYQDSLEATLRRLGFGYRSAYISKTVRILSSDAQFQDFREGDIPYCITKLLSGEICCVNNYLYSLRSESYETCIRQLVKLSGIGRKVADCISLFSLDKLESIPIDTHVWRISMRDYRLLDGKGKQSLASLTPKIYATIMVFYQSRFPLYAGWAHSLLFVADLDKFKNKKLT
jgi:N-glycosylase/DNA lyase